MHYRGRHGTVTAGKIQAGKLAEGHGEGSSRLTKETGAWKLLEYGDCLPFLRFL